jgi:hypothetical protein
MKDDPVLSGEATFSANVASFQGENRERELPNDDEFAPLDRGVHEYGNLKTKGP